MAIREITYTLSPSGISPAAEQFGGVQGDHRATKLTFKFNGDLIAALNACDNLRYRFDAYDGEGNVCQTEGELTSENSLEYFLEERLTRAGGKIAVVLVCTQVNDSIETKLELYNFPALLRLKNKPHGNGETSENRESYTTLLESAKNAADSAKAAANFAKEFAQQSEFAANVAAETAKKTATNVAEEALDDKMDKFGEVYNSDVTFQKNAYFAADRTVFSGEARFEGEVNLLKPPTLESHAVNKKYVDSAVSDAVYFDIEPDGTIFLKPEYRGAAIKFSSNSTILGDLGPTTCEKLEHYSQSDNGFEKDGSLINYLPEVLHIPSVVNGITVTKLAPAMFAYNKRIKQVILPQGITIIHNECFAYAINLTDVKNIEEVTGVSYGAFFATGIIEPSFPNLTQLFPRAFMKSGHLRKINLGKITAIPDRCFEHCSDLEVIESDNKITSVGVGAFFNTSSLRKADFVSNLTNIGDYAFKRCALNFNWVEFAEEKGSGVKFGKYATPLQTVGSSLTARHYNIKMREKMLPAPLRLDQQNPEWVDLPLNINETYATSCRYMSVMNAYCGFNNLEYDDVYSLAQVNTKKNAYIDKEISSGDEFNSYLENIDSDTNKPIEIGEIARYIGEDDATYINAYDRTSKAITATEETFKNNHYYQLTWTENQKQSLWVDLGDRQLTNMDLFCSDASYKCMDNWYKNLGLKDGEPFEPTPANYYRILEALQNGSYVVMNVPNAYNHANGHAIVLYGLNANGEVLFVESSVPGRNAIGDYTACTGSMLLQNMVSLVENNGTVLGFPKCYAISKLPEILTNGTVTVYDGKLYEATEPISELTIQYGGTLNPTNDFICSLVFTAAADGDININFPTGTKFIGGRPAFSKGETWELNIMNGVVVGGKIS